jgi:SulP family sulfate permease
LILCEIRKQPRHALEKAGFIGEIGGDNILENVDEAIKRAQA